MDPEFSLSMTPDSSGHPVPQDHSYAGACGQTDNLEHYVGNVDLHNGWPPIVQAVDTQYQVHSDYVSPSSHALGQPTQPANIAEHYAIPPQHTRRLQLAWNCFENALVNLRLATAELTNHPVQDLGFQLTHPIQAVSNSGFGIPSSELSPLSFIPPNIVARAQIHVRDLYTKKGHGCKRTGVLEESPKKFQCTRFCGRTFSDRGKWKEHEEITYPQRGWVCLVNRTVTDDIPCSGPFYRKDYLTRHFRRIHPGLEAKAYVENWSFSVDTSDWPSKCGFCPMTLRDWDKRFEHIGQHYEDNKDMHSWKEEEDDDEEDDEEDDDDNDGYINEGL